MPRDMDSRVLDRAVGLARSARPYLPGFGTSGSLLAGAALMFVLASALVAFRGWPHLGTQPSPGEVVVSPRPAAASHAAPARRRRRPGPAAGDPRAAVVRVAVIPAPGVLVAASRSDRSGARYRPRLP